MTPTTKKLILQCIDAEMQAFGASLVDRQPAVDFEKQPLHVPDVRQQHIQQLRVARADIEAIKTVRD